MGKERFWKIYIDPKQKDVIIRHDGINDKNAKEKEPTLKQVKGNTLRSGEEQALKEIQKMWLSKLDQNFKPSENDKEGTELYKKAISAKMSQNSSNTSINLKTQKIDKKAALPNIPVMLAKDFLQSSDTITVVGKKMIDNSNELVVQPKLDGVRCIASYDSKNDKVYLRSRTMKEYSFLTEIKESLRKVFKKYPDVIFDGEIYFHDERIENIKRYQMTSSIAKITRNAPSEDENLVEYWIFDIVDLTKTFKERYTLLNKIFKNKTSFEKLILTPTVVKDIEDCDEDEIMNFLSDYHFHQGVEKGFEGIMVRKSDSMYKNGRSSDLLKYKNFEDEEWLVVDAKESSGGNQTGAVVWILVDQNNSEKVVEAKQVGSVEESRNFFKNKNKYIGKKINIRFNGKTKDGIPRFPRAIAFVEDK